jgi:UDP-N-acetylglucosamine transferase subunit ALG13
LIFVTVGTQLPFDRLLAAVDGWASSRPQEKLFGQIGPAKVRPAHFESVDFVPPSRANELFLQASLIVSHAGMGSILNALKYRKPILIMPRLASLNEHRNNHQVATAKWLMGRPGVSVAWDDEELVAMLQNRDQLTTGSAITESADPAFIEQLRNAIHGD